MKNPSNALLRALQVSTDAARLGFDWPDVEPALDKIDEELRELREALAAGTNIEDELGDLFFSVVNVARKLNLDPNQALHGTNDKFSRRFDAVLAGLKKQAIDPQDATLEQMDELWEHAKRDEPGRHDSAS